MVILPLDSALNTIGRLSNPLKSEDLEVDGRVCVDGSNPKMRRARQSIADLAAFMAKAPEEFVDAFEEEHDYQFDIGNRDFWDAHVDI